jgi:hypothetical protein
MRPMKYAFGHRFMITDGWEGVSSQHRHLQWIRKRRQEARPATWRRLRRSSCKNIKAGRPVKEGEGKGRRFDIVHE